MRECLSCQNRCGDCRICFSRLHNQLDAARAEARDLRHALLEACEIAERGSTPAGLSIDDQARLIQLRRQGL